MIHKLTSTLFVAAALCGANSLHAQQILENFSSFQSPQTLFFGAWSASGDPFAGDTAPVSTFSQGAGSYNFASATNADSAYVERSLIAPVTVSTNSLVSISLRLLADNTAESLTVFLLDSSANSAFATFQTSDFNTTVFVTRSLALTADPSFDYNEVSAFRLTGNDPFASFTVSVAVDTLATITPVPEPATYGLVASGAVFALAAWRRRSASRSDQQRPKV